MHCADSESVSGDKPPALPEVRKDDQSKEPYGAPTYARCRRPPILLYIVQLIPWSKR